MQRSYIDRINIEVMDERRPVPQLNRLLATGRELVEQTKQRLELILCKPVLAYNPSIVLGYVVNAILDRGDNAEVVTCST